MDSHFKRALEYKRLFYFDEVWVIHFTCQDGATEDPYWPGGEELREGLRVAHVWHDLEMNEVVIVGCWWQNDEKFIDGPVRLL